MQKYASLKLLNIYNLRCVDMLCLNEQEILKSFPHHKTKNVYT